MATRDRKAKPIEYRKLLERFQALARAIDAGDDIETARLARLLAATDGPTIVTLQAVGDAAVFRATRPGRLTYEQAMDELDYGSRSRISDAVRRHNRRVRGEL